MENQLRLRQRRPCCHSDAYNAAARAWYSDQRYWAIVVEFQPSGWSKGSYLNIAANWFWHPGPCYSLWQRPRDFIPFKSEEQFALIENMAAMAAREVFAMRERFKTLADIQQHLTSSPLRDGSQVHNAAIASWLLGDIELRIAEWPTYGYDWEQKLKKLSATFAIWLDEPPNFWRKSSR